MLVDTVGVTNPEEQPVTLSLSIHCRYADSAREAAALGQTELAKNYATISFYSLEARYARKIASAGLFDDTDRYVDLERDAAPWMDEVEQHEEAH